MSRSPDATGKTEIRHVDPEGLYSNPQFTQVVSVAGPVRTVRVAGQTAVDTTGKVVGRGDLGTQSRKVLDNVRIALEAVEADLGHVIGWTFYLVAGQDPTPLLEAYRAAWNERPKPPMITLLYVAGLANPDLLIEIETLAVVPLD